MACCLSPHLREPIEAATGLQLAAGPKSPSRTRVLEWITRAQGKRRSGTDPNTNTAPSLPINW